MKDEYRKINTYISGLIKESDSGHTAWNLEKIRDGKETDWNYIDGCMITALLGMAEITGDKKYFDFAENFISSFVGEDGSIRTFRPGEYNLDDISEGRVLFELYDKTGKEKYKKAAALLYKHLMEQPRTWEGNFWHKLIYPEQVWLDGIYMAQPFYALYERDFGDGDFSDIVRQIRVVRERMRDPGTGLYYHGYDASRRAFWADPGTGRSENFWLRAIGWFSVALADLLGIIPAGEEDRAALEDIFRELCDAVIRYRDEETGMYWQVPDQPAREGNYLETSGSSMIAYAMLKGARLKVLPDGYAAAGEKTFDGIFKNHLFFTGDTLNLRGICLVAGLGPEDNPRRDGSYEYYISEPVVENDAKGVAPFILAYTEILRRGQPL